MTTQDSTAHDTTESTAPTLTYEDGDTLAHLLGSVEGFLVRVTLHDGREVEGYLSSNDDTVDLSSRIAATKHIQWDDLRNVHIF